jgi:hypothetical protein
LPFGLYAIFKPLWQAYTINILYFGGAINLTLLRIRIPKDMMANPKAMENVIAGLAGSYGTITFYQQLMRGTLHNFYSLEIVGTEGDIGFYILVPGDMVRLVEKLIYANFPDVEIEVGAEDYFKKIPATVPDENWNMWGTKWILSEDDSRPIATYPLFEDKISGEIMDPLATIFEAMGTLGSGEHLIFQIQIVIPDPNWRKEGQKVIDDILKKYNMSPSAEIEEGGSFMKALPYHELEIIKAVHSKQSKPAFKTQIMMAYIARREVFNAAIIGIIPGTLKQFESGSLNSFATDKYYTASAYFLLSDRRGYFRKRRLIRLMQDREPQGILNTLNVEEIATLFHFPTPMTKVPSIPRMDSKRAPAPPNLPVSE